MVLIFLASCGVDGEGNTLAYNLLYSEGMKTFSAAASLLVMMFVSTASFADGAPAKRPTDAKELERKADELAQLGPGPVRGVDGTPKGFHLGKIFSLSSITAPDGSHERTTQFALGPKFSRTAKTISLKGKTFLSWFGRPGSEYEKRTTYVGPFRTTERVNGTVVEQVGDERHIRHTELARNDNGTGPVVGPRGGQVTKTRITHTIKGVDGGRKLAAQAYGYHQTPISNRK
jgi:hypothetical protein